MRRRILGQKAGAGQAQVDMAPLIDMVFILLIFFMVTTSFVRESGVEIDRPSSKTAEFIEEGYLIVAVEPSGLVHVLGRPIPPDSIRGIQTAMEETGKQRILIQADREVPTHRLLEVLDTCRLAGADHVDVAAIEGA